MNNSDPKALTVELSDLIKTKVQEILAAGIQLALPEMEEALAAATTENVALREAVDFWRKSSDFWQTQAIFESGKADTRAKTGIDEDALLLSSTVIADLPTPGDIPANKMIGPPQNGPTPKRPSKDSGSSPDGSHYPNA